MNEGRELKNMQWFCQYPLWSSFIAVVFREKLQLNSFYFILYLTKKNTNLPKYKNKETKH